jgi:16S rRNA (adenine1518-N6/adenine1519-N6)-dimethyltransferase
MDLLEKTKFLLRRHQFFPRKSLGQNFTIDPSIFQFMGDCASLNSNDVVLEIGAGLGYLTRFLAGKCKTVLALETDERLIKILGEELADLSNVNLIKGDVFKLQLPNFNKVVSIPPYSISTRLLLWLFPKNFECAVLILQDEFASRLMASVGNENYGWLAVVAYYYVEVELLDKVSKRMFYPQPKVNSVIIRLKPKKPRPFALKNEGLFKQLVQFFFTHRNRKVKNAIALFTKSISGTTVEKVIKKAETFPFYDKRVQELAPEDFGALANALAE